jgi:hypothetical protein
VPFQHLARHLRVARLIGADQTELADPVKKEKRAETCEE